MSDDPFQNIDINIRNPFTPPEPTIPTTPTSPTPTPKSFKFTIPQDPKIKLLLILGIIIAGLSILSLIVTAFRRSQLRGDIRPTSTPSASGPTSVRPTDVPAIPLPTDINSQFEKIDRYTQTDVRFDPPQIDPDIGL